MSKLLIKNVQLINGVDDNVLENANVLIDDGKFSEINPQSIDD